MDAREFSRERKRMHEYYSGKGSTRCGKCPMGELNITAGTVGGCEKLLWEYPEKVIEVVERWSAEHPHKTRQSEFLKMFPRASMTSNGTIDFCPESFDEEFVCPERGEFYRGERECLDCLRKFWLEEIEDDEAATE